MLSIVIFSLFAASVLAVDPPLYSFSPAVGSGGGTPYSITGDEKLTAVRVWESYGNHIYGIQFRYGSIWSPVAGYISGEPQEIQLADDERIIQISGKYSHYIQSLVLVTSKGRSLHVGQPAGYAFNMYPANEEAELVFISGRIHGGLTEIEAHWAAVRSESAEH